MDKYVEQLVEMIYEAYQNKVDPIGFVCFKEEMEEIEHLFDEQKTLMKCHFGIPQEYFPPIEKLEEKHFNMLVPEIFSLWKTFNYLPSFPKIFLINFAIKKCGKN